MLCQTSKIVAMRIFIFILFLLVLLGCSQSDDEAPIQIENANYIFGVGKRRTSYLEVSNKCIIVEIDFPEFNLCKQ